MPDATLFALAESSALLDDDALDAQVERMLADPRASQPAGFVRPADGRAGSPQNGGARVTGALVVPRDRWFCLRAHVRIGDIAGGDTDGSVQLFVDDALALDATPFDTLPEQGVSLLRAGIDWSSGQDAFFEVFMDDLVLATEPVACPDR